MEPVTCSGVRSGADSKPALWPGMSNTMPPPADVPDPFAAPSEPRPGNTDIDGGVPPAGLTMNCRGPARLTSSCRVPCRPG